MSELIQIYYSMDTVCVSWPDGTVHTYEPNVDFHQLKGLLANCITDFWMEGKMDLTSRSLLEGPADCSAVAVAVQDLCRRYEISITCTGNIWQVTKGDQVLLQDYKLERALERLTKDQVS